MNLTYLESLKRIVQQEHELSTMKVPPIHSYGNFGFHFLTMWTRRCLKWHWRRDKKIAYSRNAKIANAEILKTYFSYNFFTSGFELPLPCDFGNGWPKVYSGQIWENRPREIVIIKKSNFANANFPIQDCLNVKTSIAYTVPILYDFGLNLRSQLHPKISPPNLANLVGY